ncbi:50S ribosomal protein L23 [Patescibacteria group bacterium]
MSLFGKLKKRFKADLPKEEKKTSEDSKVPKEAPKKEVKKDVPKKGTAKKPDTEKKDNEGDNKDKKEKKSSFLSRSKDDKKEKDVRRDEGSGRTKGKITGNLISVLIRPDVTEKSAFLQEMGQYVFIVEKKATKKKVKQAVELLYDVDVSKVRMLNRIGKTVQRNRIEGKQKDIKKAIVSVKKGQSIQIYDQEEAQK